MTGNPLPAPEQTPADDAANRAQNTNGEVSADPFDLQAMRIDGLADVFVETVLTTVPVRNPKRTEFIRVCGDPAYSIDTFVVEIEIDGDREIFYVIPELRGAVPDPEALKLVRLNLAITKRGTVFLWPIKLSQGNNRVRRMSDSALQAAEEAKSLWVRVAWDRELAAWGYARAKADLGEPQWPAKSFGELLKIAFRLNLIDKPDHPVFRELEGDL
jgi:hypothetical protein